MRERVLLRSVAVTDARRGRLTQSTGVPLPQPSAAGPSGATLSHRRGVCRGVCLRDTQRKTSTGFTTTLLQVDAGLAAGTHAYTEAGRSEAVGGRRRNVLQLQDRLTDLHGVALETHRHSSRCKPSGASQQVSEHLSTAPV